MTDTPAPTERPEPIFELIRQGIRRNRHDAVNVIREPGAAGWNKGLVRALEVVDQIEREAAQPVPRADGLSRETLCPAGCGCRLWTEDADAQDCACDGPCCWDSWDDFIWNLLAYPEDARETFVGSRDMAKHKPFPALAALPPRADGLEASRLTFEEARDLDMTLRHSRIDHDYGCQGSFECTCGARAYRHRAQDAIKRLGATYRKPSGDYEDAALKGTD